jgi:small subunit ribosomal protein S16
MSLKIRLTRNKKNDEPHYRIVVIDSRKKRDGEYIEKLGWYDPLLSQFPKYSMDMVRINYWISVGAQPTERVAKFIEIEKTGKHFAKNVE